MDWFEDTWFDQDGECYRCGREMHRDPQPDSADMDKRVTIDRQNNDCPHWKVNCQLACWSCNTNDYAKKDTVGPPVRREMYTATVGHESPSLMALKLKLSELTLENTLMAIRHDIARQVNWIRGLFHHHKLSPLECATLLRSPSYYTEVSESGRRVLDRSKMGVKPVDVVTMKTAKEIMMESLKTCDDEDDDMDIDPPPIVVAPVSEQYTMTPAALKYH